MCKKYPFALPYWICLNSVWFLAKVKKLSFENPFRAVQICFKFSGRNWVLFGIWSNSGKQNFWSNTHSIKNKLDEGQFV